MSNHSVTKLDLYNLKLYGRDAELSTLLDAYRRVSKAPRSEDIANDGDSDTNFDSSSEMVVVKGCSGSGKSSLVEKMREILVAEGSPAFFASGKFDSLNVHTPYSAFVQAFTELCEQILSRDGAKNLAARRSAIRDAVGGEGTVITRLVPKMREIVGECSSVTSSQGVGGGGEEDIQSIGNVNIEAKNRFHSMFRSLVRAICSPDHPVVLFLDDMQWADIASMDLIKALLTDEESKNLLFVVSVELYGLNGEHTDMKELQSSLSEHETHEADVRMRHAQSCMWKIEKKKSVLVTNIHLGNLDVQVINRLLWEVLKLEETTTQPLSIVLYRKTQGNAFFLLKFLEMLLAEDLLTFSFATFKWTWDIDCILSQTSISDNVLDLELSKLRKLPFRSRMLLQMAACLGSQFDSSLFQFLVDALRLQSSPLRSVYSCKTDGKGGDSLDHNVLSSPALSAGDELVSEGLIEKVMGGRFKFVHNQIHRASYALVFHGRQRDLLHLRIGVLLWEHRELFHEDDHLSYVIANQLNRGSDHMILDFKREELATVNLELAEKATASAAFVTAAFYLRAGIKVLGGENQWEKKYDLSLKLHSALAKIAYCCHDFNECERMAQAVMKHGRSYGDKIPVSFTLVNLRIAEENFDEAFDLGSKMLSTSGEHIPRKNRCFFAVKAMKDLIRTQRMVKRFSDNELLTLPEMIDEEKLVAMNVLTSLILCALHLREVDQLSIMTCRTVQLTLQYGVSKYSAFGYACFGMIVCGFRGNVNDGYRFGPLALQLMERFGANEWKSRVCYMVYSSIIHWKTPLQDCLDPLLQAYRAGMESGEITDAMMSARMYCMYYVFCGLPLGPLQDDLRSFCNKMEEYGQIAVLRATLPIWQSILNLIGRSQNPLKLTGEVMDQDRFLAHAFKKKNVLAECIVYYCRMLLGYIFGDLELAAAMADSVQEPAQCFIANFALCKYTSNLGLIAIAMLKKTKKIKWWVEARKSIAKMEKWAGHVGDCIHMLLLLKAEYKSLTGKNDEVKKAYDRAISTASRSGFVYDRALANERAGDFFAEAGDNYWASHYLSQAHELYCEWGALAKAGQLEETRGSLFTPSEGTQRMAGVKGRSRFKSVHKSSDDVVTFSSIAESSPPFLSYSSLDDIFEYNMVY